MKKISKTKIASTYALALLEAAIEKKSLAKVYADVKTLTEAKESSADLVKYMTNPLWAEADKESVLSTVAQKLKLSAETKRALDTIRQNRRFADLPQILQEFIHLYYAHENVAEVTVESAAKLSAAQGKRLSALLEKKLKQKVVLQYQVFPELIGGLRVRVGSEMFDDTIATKLNRLEIMMKGEQ